MSSTVAALRDRACPGLIPDSDRNVDPLRVDSAGALGIFSRVNGGGGFALNGKDAAALEKKEKLGEAFLCARVALGGCESFVAEGNVGIPFALLSADFIAAGCVGGVSDEVR